MENFIYDYFVRPIWEHSGYNPVNTLTYAAIAIAAIFLLRLSMRGRIKMDLAFMGGVMAFVLLGSTMRTVTDSIDSHIFQPVTPFHAFVLESHIWDYGYFTVTPGIYIVVAATMLVSLAILQRIGKAGLLAHVGLALWLPHFLLLLPFMSYAAYALPILILAAIPAYAAYLYFRDVSLAGVVAGQALDGAATFFIIDYFSKISGLQYFEQHVIGGAIGSFFGTYFAFYALKVAISFGAAYALKKEGMDEWDLRFIALVLMIMGFAPGIRDILRMAVGG